MIVGKFGYSWTRHGYAYWPWLLASLATLSTAWLCLLTMIVGKFGHFEHSMAMPTDHDCWQVWPLWAQHGYAYWPWLLASLATLSTAWLCLLTMIVGKFGHFEHSMAMPTDHDCWQVWPLWAQHGYAYWPWLLASLATLSKPQLCLWTMIVGKFGYSEHSMAMSVNYDCWQVDPSKHGTAMSYGLWLLFWLSLMVSWCIMLWHFMIVPFIS